MMETDTEAVIRNRTFHRPPSQPLQLAHLSVTLYRQRLVVTSPSSDPRQAGCSSLLLHHYVLRSGAELNIESHQYGPDSFLSNNTLNTLQRFFSSTL